MSGYTKLFQSIVTSSVWCEDHATVRVWFGMMAMANAEGLVEGSIPGFASLCRVTVAEMEAAERVFLGPDPHSRTPDHEGRRLERIPGGWRILNYVLYRQHAQDKEGSKAPAMRRLRGRRRAEQEAVTPGNALPEEGTDGNEEPPTVTGDPEAEDRSSVVVTEASDSQKPDGNRPTSERHSRIQQHAREAPRIPRCTRATAAGECNHDLQRERGMYRSEGTGGRGWLCKVSEGGCGAVYPRDAPEVLRQLSAGALSALEREQAAETSGRRERASSTAEVDGLVEEFVFGERDGLRAEVGGASAAFGLWSEISEHIAKAVNPHSYATWFRPIAGARLDGKRLVVAVPNPKFAEWISSNFRDVIASAVRQAKRDGVEVAFVPEAELLLERFDAWAKRKKLAPTLHAAVLQAVRRQLGEPAA